MDDQAIVIADAHGTIRIWSPGCEKLIGYSPNEAIGQSLNLIVPEKYQAPHWAAFHIAMRDGFSKIDGQTSRVPVHCRNGEVRTFASRFHLLRNGTGQTIGAMSIFSVCDPV